VARAQQGHQPRASATRLQKQAAGAARFLSSSVYEQIAIICCTRCLSSGTNHRISCVAPTPSFPHKDRRAMHLTNAVSSHSHAACLLDYTPRRRRPNSAIRRAAPACYHAGRLRQLTPKPSERERREAGASLHELNESIRQWKVSNACRSKVLHGEGHGRGRRSALPAMLPQQHLQRQRQRRPVSVQLNSPPAAAVHQYAAQ